MNLDLPTLLAMESFVTACAGAALLMAWWGNRKSATLGLWGLANIFAAVGILCLMIGRALYQPPILLLGGCLLTLAHGLEWRAARIFNDRPAPLLVALLGAIVAAGASVVPGLQNFTGSLGLALSAVYLSAIAITLATACKAKLPARWPIVGLTVVHAAVLLIGIQSTLHGSTSQYLVPPLMSLFGLVHFESIVFSVGTAVFLLALVKERSEADSRIASGIDSLSGIANRAAFLEDAERVLERSRHEGAPVSVIMFDLDRFKSINDSYGHAVGDDVIRKYCEVTVSVLRSKDVFGRMGGEEFAVVMPGASIEAAFARAERIRTVFAEECRFIRSHRVGATASGGVSVSMTSEAALSLLLEYADEALYRAKATGRNRVKLADQIGPQRPASGVIRVA